MYCKINGYWKDDKVEFDSLVVRKYNDIPIEGDEFTDDDIFYYGLSEADIVGEIENGENTSLEFVITSYEKCFKKTLK
jgi:hypothetical protein